jgi:hypothetical protein
MRFNIGQGGTFVAAGREFGVDPRFLVAIAGHESHFATEQCKDEDSARIHNAWGWGADPPPCIHFDSWKEAIWQITKSIGTGKNYFAGGNDTVREFVPVYVCGPLGDESCRNSEGVKYWINGVTWFITDMDGDPNNLTFRVFQ